MKKIIIIGSILLIIGLSLGIIYLLKDKNIDKGIDADSNSNYFEKLITKIKKDVENSNMEFETLLTDDYRKIGNKNNLKELDDNTCDVLIEKEDSEVKVYLTCFGYLSDQYYLKKYEYDEKIKNNNSLPQS